jgi:hypothetical protein
MSENPNPSPQGVQLAYLNMLAGMAKPGQFLDVRWRSSAEPMRRRFISVARLQDAAALITVLAGENDVYIGVAPRDGSGHGGRSAISALHMAYMESDHASTAERLAAFAHPPTMVVASGTPGHHQVYWLLEKPCSPAKVEVANRRLALALARDPPCADAARILRPPGTLNHKHAPPRPVTLLVLRESTRFTLAELTAALPEDPSPPAPLRPSTSQRTGRTALDRQLLAIPAADYARVLAGRLPDREGKIRCPFHADSNPSLQLYEDGGFYCFGSGCNAGGTIFDFAGRLWGISPRGAGFIELRERLAQHFDHASAQCS